MISYIGELFSYTFIQRAFLVGILVALCASLLGVSLVLKRYSMIGDGLSHVGFGALAIAASLGWAPLYFSIPVCIGAAFLLLRLTGTSRINGDAAIAMLSAGSLAVGIMVISSTTGMSTDVYNYMFGSILSLSHSDAVLSVIISIVVIGMYVVFYPRIFAVTFDETFARATGTRAGIYNSVIAVMTALTVVIGMRMMGALLISSFIIFPALTSMRVCKRFITVTLCSAILSVVCFCIGMLMSCKLGTPSGAGIVCVNMAAFAIFALVGLALNHIKRS